MSRKIKLRTTISAPIVLLPQIKKKIKHDTDKQCWSEKAKEGARLVRQLELSEEDRAIKDAIDLSDTDGEDDDADVSEVSEDSDNEENNDKKSNEKKQPRKEDENKKFVT